MSGSLIKHSSSQADFLSIGELAERTGVAATALRYYDELGLVRPAKRVSGRRRYALTAVVEVGVIVFLREVGFSLAEVRLLLVGQRGSWRRVVKQKVAELEEQRHRLDVALAALEHGLRCPSGEPLSCPRFLSTIEGQLRGLSVEDSHALLH